jgi:hypothetical protein
LSEVVDNDDISKTSAISSWSGFIYQGKIGLYHAIKLLMLDDACSEYQLKFEHLDDFAIFDSNNIALSTHQVKAKQATKRSSYKSALEQAANVCSEQCNENTKRFFHVSRCLNDFSPYSIEEKTVVFYEYHDNKNYVTLEDIDNLNSDIIKQFLYSKGLSTSQYLISYKLDKLNSLVSSRINVAHYINQTTKKTQFEAADSNPISFIEMESCLKEESININDKKYLLERFKNKILLILDDTLELLSRYDNEQAIESLICLASCRTAIASLSLHLVEKLYYSLDPKRTDILPEEGSNDINRYIAIICELPDFLYNENIPHYVSKDFVKYLPSSIEVNRMPSKITAIETLKANLDAMRENNSLLQVLFEFDCLIVEMSESLFCLSDSNKTTQKFTHNNVTGYDIAVNGEVEFHEKVMKAKRIRFVSVEKAKGELSD